MARSELELTRTAGDRRLYALEGIGTLRLSGFASRAATAEAAGRRWQLGRSGFWRWAITAVDEDGTVVGEFAPDRLRRGGSLRWGDRQLAVRPASRWRERYALAEGDREVAVLDGKGWGRRPVAMTLAQPEAVDPGLLLFAAFVVRTLAEDATAAAAAATSSASTGT